MAEIRSGARLPKTAERRSFTVDLTAREARAEGDGETLTLVGYAAKFDRESQDLGGFREVIRKGAFARAVKEDDVRALLNHDDNHVLGRSRSGTLRMEEDATGLRVEIDLPDTEAGRSLHTSVQRGDIDQMSFQFVTRQDRWTRTEGTSPDVLRELLDVRLYDVSPVTFPAYLDTEVSVRDLVAGRDLTAEERSALAGLLGDEDPAPPASGDSPTPSAPAGIDQRRRRLDLLARA